MDLQYTSQRARLEKLNLGKNPIVPNYSKYTANYTTLPSHALVPVVALEGEARAWRAHKGSGQGITYRRWTHRGAAGVHERGDGLLPRILWPAFQHMGQTRVQTRHEATHVHDHLWPEYHGD